MGDTTSKVITVLLIAFGVLAFLPGLCVAVFDAKWGSIIVFGGWILVAGGAFRITWRVLAGAANDVSPAKLAAVVISWGALLFVFYALTVAVSMMQQLGHVRWQ